jgi:N utilization substance protein A
MEVVVEDKQLSLAIGKKGQNVRLAAKLVGWRIDIKSEEEKRQEVEAEMARMARIVEELKSLEAHGVGEKTAQRLVDAGIQGLAHVLQMSDDELCSLEGIGPKTAEKIREAAVVAKVEWDKRDAEEAERLEAERLAAEQAAEEEARRLAEEQAAAEAAEAAAAEAAAAEGVPEPSQEMEAKAVAEPPAASEGGEPDGER